jgi:phosphatidylinositol-bisphosphatase
VIGTEDPTEARNWNLLIGKTLNKKHGSTWFTSISNPISSESYQYVDSPDPESTINVSSHTGSPMVEQYEMPKSGSKYKLMASKKMVGVFISVWIKSELLRKYCISDVKVCSVACGIMGYLGNKGSVSVSMTIEGTSFCFVVAHLASGEKKGDEGRRNHQVSEIFRRTSFPRSPRIPTDEHISHPLTILGHEYVFLPLECRSKSFQLFSCSFQTFI